MFFAEVSSEGWEDCFLESFLFLLLWGLLIFSQAGL